MTDKNRPGTLGNLNKKPLNDNSIISQHAKLLSHFKKYHRLTTLQAREELGIMHPSGRTRELIKKGHNIVTLRGLVEPDAAGLSHRVALYVYLGKFNVETIQIRKNIQASGIEDRIKAASRSLLKANKLGNQEVISTCQKELNRLIKILDKEVVYVSYQDS